MRAHEERGAASRRTRRQIDDAHRRVTPVADVQVGGVRERAVGAAAHGHAAPTRQGRGIDQVDRVALVADDRHQTVSRDERDAPREDAGVRIGEGNTVERPRHAALPREAIHPVRPGAAHPHRVAPLAARAREAEPRGQLLFPHDRALHRIDPHQAVGAVAVVRDHQRPVRQRHEAHRQCAYAHAPAGRADTPPRGQQRGAVTQPAGHDTGGEQGQAGERRQSEQRSEAHGANMAAREPDVIPLGLGPT